ncbi:MAG: GlsB/YeaQ/YmgE family stress response membrane protein [Candidatus Dormibacteria bacterium]
MGAVTITIDPGSILIWAVIGLVAGYLASRVVTGHGMGVVADVVVGLVGALAAGFLANLVGVSFSIAGQPIITDIVVAFVGAVILLAIGQALTGSRRRRR